ncbi:putative glucooligosaccharide oxidase [Whalleya microplaca]|nr:putative glucooligosaccharide oxidase [Whalleya microplaca]
MGTILDTTPVTSCMESIMGPLANKGIPIRTASDADWDIYSKAYNLRLPAKPAIVALPETIQHISDAVICASENGIKVQAKSGGHSYASFSNGGTDGAMVIELKNFQDIEFVSYNIVRVGGGVRLGNLAVAIYNKAKLALSHGTCASVGVGGHFTHGGYGLSSRTWGLAMDQIVGLDVVMADGSYVHASMKENPDLYYAMRGTADSFGIAVNFYLAAQPAPKSVLNWRVEINTVMSSVENAVNAFLSIQNFTHDATVVDRHLGFNLTLGPEYFAIGGTYVGTSLDHFATTIVPALLKDIPEKAVTTIEKVDWLASLKLLNNNEDLNVSWSDTTHSNFFAKSVTVPEPGFSREALSSFFHFLLNEGKRAPVSYFILVDLYGGADSQINTKDLEFSAFAHRDSLWVIQLYGYVDNDKVFPAEGLDFVNRLAESVTAKLPEYGAYDNYVDSSLTREQAHKLYRGEKMSQKLKVIKEKLDPNNVFENPQSIATDGVLGKGSTLRVATRES